MSRKILTVTFNPAVDHSVEVNRFRAGEVNRAISSRKDPGGKGINVATALAMTEFEVAATGFLGLENADIFRKHFAAGGIEDEFLYLEGMTREGIKINDPSDSSTTDVNFKGLEPTLKDLDNLRDKYRKLLPSVDYVVLSGSLPPGIPADIYAEFASDAKKAGAFTALDTIGKPLLSAIESGAVSLIKPNLEELLDIYPDCGSPEDYEVKPELIDGLVAKALAKTGMVALTLGGSGSRLYKGDDVWEAGAPVVELKSTVGAGDSFLAGLISGLASEMAPGEALRTAVSVAASKLTKFGPGWSVDNPPENFIDKITVEGRKISL